MQLLSKVKLFAGGRIIKTAVAVFITAFLCDLLNLPSAFAVITAIVTIEPTASDSIKKGVIRFFASSIGAAFSMLFSFLFGEQPITYTLVAAATIIACHKLRLKAGMLVATLTAVAMVSFTHAHFLVSFFIRLSTTTIGIIVSTLVNLVILPPNYSPIISNNVHHLYIQAAHLLEKRILEILHIHPQQKETKTLFEELVHLLEKTEQLCQFQKEEWKFHRHTKQEMRIFHYEHKKLNLLRQIIYHIGNLLHMPLAKADWNEREKNKVVTVTQSLVTILQDPNHLISEEHKRLTRDLLEEFWHYHEDLREHRPQKYHHLFSPETVILYEILSIHDLAEELHHVQLHESRYQNTM
jgi:uncharacterized membrane protein YgaE (UPF0421/DUF939 family)